MKIECAKEKIVEATTLTSRFSGKHPTLPVLSALFCEAKNGKLTLRATNLDAGIEMSIPVKISRDGALAVPAHTLSQTLSNIQGKQVILEEKNGNLAISSGSYKTTIKCLPKDDFPTIPSVTEGDVVEVAPERLAQGIESVVYAASMSDIKPELASVYIYPENNALVFVSTDSFRLAEKKVPMKNTKDFGGIILPYKNAIEIARALSSMKGGLSMRFSKHHLSLSSETTHITSRLIEGSFPDYKQIIPKEEKTTAIILKQDLMQTLKVVSVFANKFNQLSLSVKPQEKKFIIETKNADVGEGSAQIDAALSGETVDLNVNARYFSDCIPHIHHDSVSIAFNGPGKPIILRGVADPMFTYLVMPMNR